MMVALFLLCFSFPPYVNAGAHNDKATVAEQHEEARRLLNNGDLIGLGEYLSKHPSVVNHLYSNGLTLLSLAVFDGEREAVRYLLANGSDPNLGRPKENKPLWALVDGMMFTPSDLVGGKAKGMEPYLEIAVMLFDVSVDYDITLQRRGVNNEEFQFPIIQELFELICAKDRYANEHSKILAGSKLQKAMKGSHELLKSQSVSYKLRYGFLSPACVSLMFPGFE
jgi:ankyrin repeat protein